MKTQKNFRGNIQLVAGTLSLAREHARFGLLTEKQQTILDQLVLGKSNKEIAGYLRLKESTIKAYIAAIYKITRYPSRVLLALHWQMYRGAIIRPTLTDESDGSRIV